jgi:hypothetical protein
MRVISRFHVGLVHDSSHALGIDPGNNLRVCLLVKVFTACRLEGMA